MFPRAHFTVRPLPFGHSVPQVDGVAWMKEALARGAPAAGLDEAAVTRAGRYYDLLDRATSIRSRTTSLDDYTHTDWDRMTLWAPDNGSPWYEPSLERRTAAFAETALSLARETLGEDLFPPDVLVQVSCTGYDSPNAIQRVAVERGWNQVQTIHLGHMGCYAALPAVAMAADLVAAETARRPAGVPSSGDGADVESADPRATIMLVELCTLHLRPTTIDSEQIVQQALFADGAARIDVTPEARGDTPVRGFDLIDHAEVLVPDSLDAMTWRVADGAFRMTLSRAIPEFLRRSLPPAVTEFLAGHGLTTDDVPYWAVHPGGPKIIESSADALGLSEASVRHSQSVLASRGNMSSATLPHIWSEIATDPDVESGALVVSLAFGPGLTVAMNLMVVG